MLDNMMSTSLLSFVFSLRTVVKIKILDTGFDHWQWQNKYFDHAYETRKRCKSQEPKSERADEDETWRVGFFVINSTKDHGYERHPDEMIGIRVWVRFSEILDWSRDKNCHWYHEDESETNQNPCKTLEFTIHRREWKGKGFALSGFFLLSLLFVRLLTFLNLSRSTLIMLRRRNFCRHPSKC